nr:MAG TPA: helix-turn-helix domain protein [Inoviridae sp.]
MCDYNIIITLLCENVNTITQICYYNKSRKMEKEIMKYNQILRNLREDADLKQKDISEKLYLGKNTYYNYEKGTREIPFSLIIELAKLYEVSIDYIAGITNDKGGMHKNSEEEAEILRLYNSLDDKRKGKAELFLEQLAKQQSKENKINEVENNISINQQNNGTATININNKG